MAEVIFNGKRYAITGRVQRTPVVEFSAPLRLGPASLDDRNLASFIVLNDLRGGLGVKHGDVREDINRYAESEGLDPRFHEQLTLPPLVTTHASLVSASGLKNAFYHESSVSGADIQYLGYYQTLYKSTDGGNMASEEDFSDHATATVEDIITYTDSNGARKMYVALGPYGYSHSADGTTFTEIAANGTNQGQAYAFCEYDSKLLKIGQNYTTGVWEVRWSIDPSAASPSWTLHCTLPGSANFIKGAGSSLFFTEFGEYLPYLSLTAGSIHATRPTLALFDFPAGKVYPIDLGLAWAGAGFNATIWRDMIVATDGRQVVGYKPGQPIRDLGLQRDDGLPSTLDGNITSMIPHPDALYCIWRAKDLGTHRMLCYDGAGWHVVSTAKTGYSITASYCAGYNKRWRQIRWAALNGANIDEHRFTFPTVPNPMNDSTQTYEDGPLTLITPWYDLGFAADAGAFLKCEFDGACPTTSETVKVEYAVNGSASWTTIDTFTATHTSATLGSGAGVSFRTVRFRITLDRGATTTNTPNAFPITFRFFKRPQLREGFKFVIDVNATAGPDRDEETIISELETAYNSATIPTFQYGRKSTYAILVSQVATELGPEDPQDAGTRKPIISVQLAEVL